MCHEGNSAPLSVRYLNAQLTALWENAVECSEHSGVSPLDVTSDAYQKSKYIRALSQFQYLGKRSSKAIKDPQDFRFYSIFDKPELRFICNHEAVLFLTIKEGYANLDYDLSFGFRSKFDRNKSESIRNIRAAFRVKFFRQDVRFEGCDLKFNHYNRMLILDFQTANLVALDGIEHERLSPDLRKALNFYLHQYLKFLMDAGNHTFLDLPSFRDDKFKTKIDYIAYEDTSVDLSALSTGVTVHGIDIDVIRTNLFFKWQNGLRNIEGSPDNGLAEFIIAESPNVVSAEGPCRIRFDIPKVDIMCSCEVRVTFIIRNIAVFDPKNSDKQSSVNDYDWSFTFIVPVERDKPDSKHITLDFNVATFSSRFSSKLKNTTKAISEFFKKLIHFFKGYFKFLRKNSLDKIQLPLSDKSDDEESDDEDIGDEENDLQPIKQSNSHLWTERIEKTRLFGFDQVLALSEASINSLFFDRWRAAHDNVEGSDFRFAKWSRDEFSANFQPMKVRFLSNGKAVLILTIDDGTMSVGRAIRQKLIDRLRFPEPAGLKTEVLGFKRLRVAFEVDLGLSEDKELHIGDGWQERFKKSFIYTCHQNLARFFKHLLLNFRRSKYIRTLSNVATLGEGYDSPARLETLLDHIENHYLPELAEDGHNIIHTIPVFTDRNQRTFGYTAVAHEVVSNSKQIVTVENCSHVNATMAPIVLIFGMCDFRPMPRPAPSHRDKWLSSWVIQDKSNRSFGTLCISKGAFLKERLLPLLERVNAATTIVPKFAGLIAGETDFDITTWDQSDLKLHYGGCSWSDNDASENLEYVWKDENDWHHNHKVISVDIYDDRHFMTCHTRNSVQIPTADLSNRIEIKIIGESRLLIGYKHNEVGWSMETTAKWSASICLVFSNRGENITISVSDKINPDISLTSSQGQGNVDIFALHRKHLPSVVDLSEAVEYLKSTFEGGWEFSNPGGESYRLSGPVFTRQGDLVVQLCERRSFAAEFRPASAILTPTVASGGLPNGSTTNGTANLRSPTQGDEVEAEDAASETSPPAMPLGQTTDHDRSELVSPLDGVEQIGKPLDAPGEDD